jgi:transcription elongation factor Elf1
MSLFIDKKYLGLVSSKLRLFKQKTDTTYSFRCPFCLDSKKSKIKTRGYVFAKKNDMFFKCFNCSRSHTFAKFLKQIDANLYREYAMDRFKNGENGKSNYEKPNFKTRFATSKIGSKTALSIPSIADLDPKHWVRQYVEGRKIPKEHLGKLYFAKDFAKFVQEIFPGRYPSLNMHKEMLVIPFYDELKNLIAVQGRVLDNSKPKYITLKAKENLPKVFGMDRVDMERTIYVLEGPLDSLFLPNAIAAAGSDLPTNIQPEKCVFIYDNELFNKEIVEKMEEIIKRRLKIFIWPKMWNGIKDINRLIEFGYEMGYVKEIIDKNTFSSLDAEIEMSKWRKK